MKFVLLTYIFLLFAVYSNAQTAASTSLAPPVAVADTGSLPLQDLSITEKDKKALLRWKTDSLPAAESFYAVERSNDGISFSLVGIIKTINRGWTEFLDDSPPRGKIFYRIKLSSGQTSLYSAMIAASPTADVSCKFYPNPVDKVLIVRSESSIELQISDQGGKPVITDKFPGGLKVIDVSALEPGVYVITLFQKETGRQLTEKLVKK